MEKELERIRAMMEPAGSGRDVAYRREAHSRRYADDAHVYFPGPWFMGGHHRGRLEVDKMWEAVRVIWPEGTRLFRNHFFVGEDTIAIEWWSRNKVWNGVEARNSGVGRLRFRDDQVVDHYEITDCEYFEEIHGDWRARLDPELGRYLPKFRLRERPYYPETKENEWAFDDCVSDGQSRIPEESRRCFEIARQWWADAAAAGDGGSFSTGVFDDDVEIFYQGRLWPLGGRHYGRAGLERIQQVSRRLWPECRLVKTNFWAADNRVLIEWFRQGRTWSGRSCREGAFTVWEFEGERVARVRTYLDTSYWAELLTGWREVVGEALGSALPNWEDPGVPRYPRPALHE
jgi:ketosteroid isomerase-like protein